MPWQSNGGGRGGNPWGGGGGTQGPRGPRGPQGGGQPPDFDDLMRKGRERLKRMMPGGAGGRAGLILIVLIAIGLWAATGIYKVDTNEQGVVLRFGEWTRTTGPGLHWHLPWPIESALTPAVTDRKRVDVGFRPGMPQQNRPDRLLDESLMLTGDENIVDIAFTVFWRISDAGNYLFNIQSPQEATVKSVAESVMRSIIGRTPIQRALTEGRSEIQRTAGDRIQTVLESYEAGIEVLEVNLEKVDPPQQVIEAFRDVQAAEADRERFRNEADRYANQIIPEARGQANQIIQEAEAYREEVIAEAEGQADRFVSIFEEYSQAEEVTRKRIYLQTLEEVLAPMEKILIDESAGSGVVPYMALPELQRRGGGRDSGGGSGSSGSRQQDGGGNQQ